MTKTCTVCGKTYEGLKEHFSQRRVMRDGKEKRVWKDICKTCEHKQ
jgi:hypothetical protein